MRDQAKETEIHEDIAVRLMCGDESVLEDILRLPMYAPAIQRVIKTKYQGYLTIEDIEDVTSWAVLQLWENRTSYDDSKGTVKNLLCRIADNRAKDVLKYGWKKAQQMESHISTDKDEEGYNLLEQLATFDRYPGKVEDEVLNNDKLNKDLQDCLNKLRGEYKYILEADALAGGEGMDSAELGRKLNAPVGTIRAWRSRAKDEVRKAMRLRGYNF